MKKFKSSIKTTSAVCNGVLRAALGNNGYEINDNGSFIEAYDGEKALTILLVSRCLSDRSCTETTPIAASVAGVRKLLERYKVEEPKLVLESRDVSALDVMVENVNMIGEPCIAFGVCKYSYSDIEIAVVPLRIFFQKAETGSVLSIGQRSGDFFYDYAKANNENTQGFILRSSFSIKDYETEID